MHLKDLQLETHHTGKVLVLRLIATPKRISGITSIVEDEFGDVDQIWLYSQDPSFEPSEVLPLGQIIAIKQPYYRVDDDGGFSIRVDHLSDLVSVTNTDSIVPLALAPTILETSKTASEWKEEGNRAYSAKLYSTAIQW